MVNRFIPQEERPTKLKMILDHQTVAKSRENQKIRSSMYASDYGQCQRRVYFSFFPEEYPVAEFDARTLRIFANGNDVHERLGGYLKMDDSLDFHDEVNVPRDNLDVHGRCDGICVVEDQAMVVEFKSINKEVVDKAKEEHIGQLTWYLTMFKELRRQLKEDFGYKEFDVVSESDLHGITSLSGRQAEELNHVEKWLMYTQGEIRGEIIYESKSLNETYHFPLDFDVSRSNKIRLWYEQLKHHVDNKIVPNVKNNPNYYPCRWKTGQCAYWETCHGVDSKLINKG